MKSSANTCLTLPNEPDRLLMYLPKAFRPKLHMGISHLRSFQEPNISTWLSITPYTRRCVSICSSLQFSSSRALQLGHTCAGVQHLCNLTSSTLKCSMKHPKIPPHSAKTKPLGRDRRKSEGGVFGSTLMSMLSAHFAHPAARAFCSHGNYLNAAWRKCVIVF